ncbi:hypothetical protein ACO0K9_19010 [Undibacterium sp. Ji50W]|uniref:hypothetical protein n=1 Tax=Undibacterium TaxID=401469 RepID=UPI003BF18971
MSAHYSALIVCSLLMYAQATCAQEVKQPASAEGLEQQNEVGKNLPADRWIANRAGDANPVNGKPALGPQQATADAELDGFPVPSASGARLPGRTGNTQAANGQDLYARVTKEYYSQSASLPSKQEKPDALSRFGVRYSPAGNDHLWLEYRFSEKSAIRLRGAAHRGVKVLAVIEY